MQSNHVEIEFNSIFFWYYELDFVESNQSYIKKTLPLRSIGPIPVKTIDLGKTICDQNDQF